MMESEYLLSVGKPGPCDCGRTSSQGASVTQVVAPARADEHPGAVQAGFAVTPEAAKFLANLEAKSGLRVAPLRRAITSLQDLVGLMRTAAVGDLGALGALRDIVLSSPAPTERGLSRGDIDRRFPPFRQPFPGPEAGCQFVVPIDPFLLLGNGVRLAAGPAQPFGRPDPGPPVAQPGLWLDGPTGAMGGFDASDGAVQWSQRLLGSWLSLAAVVEGALATALVSGDLPALSFDGDLPNPLPPPRGPALPCLDNLQTCISEVIFTAIPLLRSFGPPGFPQIGSISPIDQCASSPGPITLYPQQGSTFPAMADLPSGVFLAVDGSPAATLSWSPSQIVVDVPPILGTGCHKIGWVRLLSTDDVNQIRAIGEMCRPWLRSSFTFLPFVNRDDQQSFSLVGAPIIQSFQGPGGVDPVQAEACRPVNLVWRSYVDTCPGSATQLAVMLLEDGQPFATALPANGQAVVADARTRTYTLTVQGRVGNRGCGQARQTVTVARQARIVARALGPNGMLNGSPDTSCLPPGSTVRVYVRVSCPAPAGGIPVTISPVAPQNAPGAMGTIGEGDDSTEVEVMTANECGQATLRVSAPDHTPQDVSYRVVASPRVTAMSATSFTDCDDVTFTVDGSCFEDSALALSVLATGFDGQGTFGRITMLTPQTRIQIEFFRRLAIGDYTIKLHNCAGDTVLPSLIQIRRAPPVIQSPLSSNVNAVVLCTAPQINLKWTVRGATNVTLLRGMQQILTRTYADACEVKEDNFRDSPPGIVGALTYVLTAKNIDGVATSSTLTLPVTSLADPAGAFVAQNASSRPVNVFLCNAEDSGGTFVGTLQPNASASIPVPQCRLRFVQSIAPELVAEHNANFPNNRFDPTSIVTARTSGTWTRNTGPVALGFSSASTWPQIILV